MAIQNPKIWTVPFENEALEPWLNVASDLLTASLGHDVEIVPTEMFADRFGPKRNVVRCDVVSPVQESPLTVILRQTGDLDAYDPGDKRTWGPTYQLFDYWAGASFLSTFESKYGPRFYGGSREGGFILIEDVGQNMSLVDAFAGDDANRAEAELLDLATCLGRVHAESAEKESEYNRIRNALAPNKEPVSYRDANFIKINLDKLKETISGLGMRLGSEADSDIQAVIASLESPDDFLAFIHRDPIPPNFLQSNRGLVMLDLEFSGYGHALTDVMTLRMGSPTYGLPGRIPVHVLRKYETEYRSALVEGCEKAKQDEVYNAAAVEACGWWLMMELIRNLKTTTDETEVPDDRRNTVTERRKWIITRLTAFIDISESNSHLAGLRALATALLDRLESLWGSEARALQYFPAFEGTTDLAKMQKRKKE